MKETDEHTPCLMDTDGPPDTPQQLINKFGRCNVQDTCGMANEYPQIAQGLPKKTKPKKWGKR